MKCNDETIQREQEADRFREVLSRKLSFFNCMVALMIMLIHACGTALASSNTSVERVARLVVNERSFGFLLDPDIQLSPNSKFVYYEVQRFSRLNRVDATWEGKGNIEEDGWLQKISKNAPDGPPKKLAANGFWHPRGKLILPTTQGKDESLSRSAAFVTLLDPDTGERTLARVQAESPLERSSETLPPGGKWSVDGHYYAFLRKIPVVVKNKTGESEVEPWRGSATDSLGSWDYGATDVAGSSLFVWDMQSGRLRQVTTFESLMLSFDWSPDGDMFVVEALDKSDRDIDGKYRTNISIIRRSGELIRTLSRFGSDEAFPSWSPTGDSVAFLMYDGNESRVRWVTYQAPKLAIVNLNSNETIVFPQDTLGSLSGIVRGSSSVLDLVWSKDGRFLFFFMDWDMGVAVAKGNLDTQQLSITPLEPSHGEAIYGRYPVLQPSLSADGKVMAFSEFSPTQPAELFVADIDESKSILVATRITNLHDDFALKDAVRIDKISWPSTDGKFVIHAQLLTPADAWKGDEIVGSLPTILSFQGGPSAVFTDFGGAHWGAEFSLAVRGYAVLVPNTRGRAGYGYGELFAHGIRDGRSRYELPFQDGVAGLDYLVSKGISNPAKIGVFGHSYGSSLTEYSITKTNRFKAAVSSDGGFGNLMSGYRWNLGGYQRILNRNMFALDNPYDQAEQRRMILESPLLHVDNIKTPTLLLYSDSGDVGNYARIFYRALRCFGVPSSLVRYHWAHGPVGVLQNTEVVSRIVEWMDYWVRGIPYPDAKRAKDYSYFRTESSLCER